MLDFPIDFVVPWVDGSDPAWLRRRSEFGRASASNSPWADPQDCLVDGDERYRDFPFFRYWFRGVETCAPWVRTVHFVTEGHVPSWLNMSHPKLNIVKHDEFIPADYLPTFSSHPIELNLHRIEGLAEHFVYFNDDFHLISAVSPNDFFGGGLPRRHAILTPIIPGADGFYHILGNDVAVINKHFEPKQLLRRVNHWLVPGYGVNVLRTLLMLPYPAFTGFYNAHGPAAFRKSSVSEVWAREPEILDTTCRNRFRTPRDVNQYLFQWWDIATGNMAPLDLRDRYRHFRIAPGHKDSISSKGFDITRGKFAILYDGDLSSVAASTIDDIVATITDGFDAIFPQKSEFEI